MIYLVEHAAAGDILRTFEGVTEGSVTDLMSQGGNPFEFITAEDYAVRLAATES